MDINSADFDGIVRWLGWGSWRRRWESWL